MNNKNKLYLSYDPAIIISQVYKINKNENTKTIGIRCCFTSSLY